VKGIDSFETAPARRDGIKHVAMLGSLPPLRALSPYCLGLATAMAEAVKVEFISFDKIYPGFLYPGRDLEEDHTFPAIDHPNLRVRRQLAWYNPLTWIVEGLTAKGALLHAQWWSLPLWPIYAFVCSGFKARRRPIVFTVHNIRPHEDSRIYESLCRVLFKLGDHFIVHSAENRDTLREVYNIPDSRMTQIAHGPLEFPSGVLTREGARQDLGFSNEHRVVLFFGAIRSYKGVDVALRALADLREKMPEVRLLIAGKPWETWASYEAIISALGIAPIVNTDLRYIPAGEVAKFFLAADLVILPYRRFDAQSGVGAAALAFRKPLIVTDVGGLPDLVEDRSWVVPADDWKALAEKMGQCLCDPERLLKMARGSGRLREAGSWAEAAKQTFSVYESVLGLKSTLSCRQAS
jgi:glycosyltransferase involved in cell wall biosynthesis